MGYMGISFILGLLLVIFNAIVTIGLFRSDLYEPRQKLLQFFMIWLMPIIGSSIVWYILREDSRPTSKNIGDSGNEYLDYNYPEKNDPYFGHHGGSDLGD